MLIGAAKYIPVFPATLEVEDGPRHFITVLRSLFDGPLTREILQTCTGGRSKKDLVGVQSQRRGEGLYTVLPPLSDKAHPPAWLSPVKFPLQTS